MAASNAYTVLSSLPTYTAPHRQIRALVVGRLLDLSHISWRTCVADLLADHIPASRRLPSSGHGTGRPRGAAARFDFWEPLADSLAGRDLELRLAYTAAPPGRHGRAERPPPMMASL